MLKVTSFYTSLLQLYLLLFTKWGDIWRLWYIFYDIKWNQHRLNMANIKQNTKSFIKKLFLLSKCWYFYLLKCHLHIRKLPLKFLKVFFDELLLPSSVLRWCEVEKTIFRYLNLEIRCILLSRYSLVFYFIFFPYAFHHISSQRAELH